MQIVFCSVRKRLDTESLTKNKHMHMQHAADSKNTLVRSAEVGSLQPPLPDHAHGFGFARARRARRRNGRAIVVARSALQRTTTRRLGRAVFIARNARLGLGRRAFSSPLLFSFWFS